MEVMAVIMCGIWLCNKPPQDRVVTIKRNKKKKKGRKESRHKSKPKAQKKVIKKFPKKFYVDVPIFDESGKIQTDSQNKPVYVREYGEYTCYLLAHRERWKNKLHEKQLSTIQELQRLERTATPGKRKR